MLDLSPSVGQALQTALNGTSKSVERIMHAIKLELPEIYESDHYKEVLSD